MMLKVALHYFSGFMVSHDLPSVYSLHREKKKKDNDKEKSFLQPTVYFGNTTGNQQIYISSAAACSYLRIFSLPF